MNGAIVGLLICLPFLPGQIPDETKLDALVGRVQKTWELPGLAIVLVHEDRIAYLRGTGVREQGKPEAITPDTLFGIGSLTKAFTATALGTLVEEGKLAWDDPVRKHLPWFHLADPLADRDVTIRDLLCHRSGLARNDLLWYRAPWSVEETVRRMAHVQPTASFRNTYQYNNLAYLAAGLALGAAAGKPWQEVVREKLLQPLGMSRVAFSRSEVLKSRDYASPHRRGTDGKIAPIPMYDDDQQVRASGSIKASVRDLAAWVRFQLNEGTVNGVRVLSSRVLAETKTPQMIVPVSPDMVRLAESTQASYGLGWHITDYRGQPLFEHGGAVDGFRARILLLPRQKIGMVLLTNVETMEALQSLGFQLLDLVLNQSPRDWDSFYQAQVNQAARQRQQAEARLIAERRKNTKPSHELDAYTGTYRNPAYGSLRIDRDTLANRLVLRWSSWQLPLEHYHFDTFLYAAEARLDKDTVMFTLRNNGEIGSLRFLEQTFARAPELKPGGK